MIKFLKFSFAGSNYETDFLKVSGGFKTYWGLRNSGYFKVSENQNPESPQTECTIGHVIRLLPPEVWPISPSAEWSFAVSGKISFNPQTFVNGCFQHENSVYTFSVVFSIRAWRQGYLLPHHRALFFYSWDSFHWRWHEASMKEGKMKRFVLCLPML